MVCLICALQYSEADGWGSITVIVLTALFAFFLFVFALVQIKLQERATVPPRLMVKRQVIFSAVYVMLVDGSLFAMAYSVGVLPRETSLVSLPS